ncbi:MAG: hypothetical protein ACREEW_16520 [Caulobacteraceae bacterium]
MNPVVWLGLPAVVCVAATVLLDVPLRVFGLYLPEPVFPLALAFSWALIRPSILPPFVLVALGLFLDFFWGGPQGLWPVCLLCAYAVALVARRLILGHEFVLMWAWYAAAIAGAFTVGFALMTMDTQTPPNLVAMAWVYYAPTWLLFPFAYRLIRRYEDADVRFR